jgi:hypothetical protein
LSPITKNQSLTAYGSKAKQAHYISIADQKASRRISNELRKSYNSTLPHYVFCQGLDKTVSFSQFLLNSGFEGSHAIMHNNFGPILHNPVFSITSLIFFPYHIWIDTQLEIKIRQANRSDYISIKNILTE